MSAVLEKPGLARRVKAAPPLKWTREQYYELDRLGFFDDKRTELLEGRIVFMSPINFPHSVAVENIEKILRAVFEPENYVRTQVPLNCSTSDPQPDVQVLPGRRESYSDHGTQALLIVEVADTTFSRDTKTKMKIYAKTGNPDYWVLDLKRSELLVFREPTKTGYLKMTVFKRTQSVRPLAAPKASIKVSDMLP
jgi:Uma2 family endonuclease